MFCVAPVCDSICTVAEAFAEAGYYLVINGFAPPAEARALVGRLQQKHGIEVLYHPADLSDSDQCVAPITDGERWFGSIDVLVNNAGAQRVAPTEQFPVDR